MSETILRACILAEDGELHTGDSHMDIRLTAQKHGVFLHPLDKKSEWFITDTGRFVSREEAAEIYNAWDIKEKVQSLCSYHLNSNL